MPRDHILGFKPADGLPDYLPPSNRVIARMYAGLDKQLVGADDPALSRFERGDHLPDGTVKPRALGYTLPADRPTVQSIAEKIAADVARPNALLAKLTAQAPDCQCDVCRAEREQRAQALRPGWPWPENGKPQLSRAG